MTGAEGSLRVDLAILAGALSPQTRRRLATLIALMMASGVSELLSIGAVVPFISLLAGGEPSRGLLALLPWLPGGETNRLPILTMMFVMAVIASAALRLWLQYATQQMVMTAGHELTVEIQRRTLLQPYAYHVRQHSAALIAALEKVQAVTFRLLLPLAQATAALFIGLFIVSALIVVETFAAAAVGVVLVAAYALTARLTRERLARASSEISAAYDERIRLVQDSVGAVRDIILDSSQPAYLAAFRDADARFARARASIAVAGTAPRFIVEGAAMLLIAAASIILAQRPGGLLVALPALAALALGGQRLLPLVQTLHFGWAAITGNRAILREVAALLRLPVDNRSEREPPPLPFTRAIEIDRLCFSYDQAERCAIGGVNATIGRGEMVALIGRTGSGKTTFADLIMGLLTPSSGTIRVDGRTIDAANCRAWQRNIAHVPQSIFLTDSSIAANITLAPPGASVDAERLAGAIRDAQLVKFIASLPLGIATKVGERGIRLSGGQRQRLGLARALYKGASLLVVDEGTNALDDETEAAVLASLVSLHREGCTILIIAHRASTIAGATRVIRLEDGRLVVNNLREMEG